MEGKQALGAASQWAFKLVEAGLTPHRGLGGGSACETGRGCTSQPNFWQGCCLPPGAAGLKAELVGQVPLSCRC